MSRISTADSFYGTLTEALPEEIKEEKLEGDLKRQLMELEKIFNEDTKTINILISKARLGISLREFEDSLVLTRRAFPFKKEKVDTIKKRTYFFLAHWWMCKIHILALANEQIGYLQVIRNLMQRLETATGRDKRVHFIQFTRDYQNFLGCAVNIKDLVQEYDFVFDYARGELDSSLKTKKTRRIAWIYSHELIQGAKELLLRANFGRFTAPPLIRTALEVTVVRLLLDISNSKKYKGKEIVIKKNFFLLPNLLKSADAVGLKLTLNSESIRRLYEWRNVVVHSAHRMPHEEMWHALLLASIVGAEKKELESKTDQLLDRLRADGVIETR